MNSEICLSFIHSFIVQAADSIHCCRNAFYNPFDVTELFQWPNTHRIPMWHVDIRSMWLYRVNLKKCPSTKNALMEKYNSYANSSDVKQQLIKIR